MFKELEFSTAGVLGIVAAISLIIIGLIVYFKRKYRSYSYKDLLEANKDNKDKSLASRSKFPEVDVFRNSSVFFNFGMAAAVAISLVTMSWTAYEYSVVIPEGALDLEDEVEVEIPRTAEPPPPPPPPPPPVIQEVPDEEVIEDKVEFKSQDVTEETKVEAPKEEKKAPPPPPPPPPPKPVEEEIFKVVEQMPRFPGCEDMAGTDAEKEACAKQKMLEYIYKNLKYPAIARENGVEGQVVIQFVVDKDGSITETKVVRDIGAGCGAAAEAVVLGMNNMGKKWTPGKQRGRPVKVLYTLPVKFKLEG
jgi:protein TonB